MDNLHNRLTFNLSKRNKIFSSHSLKEDPKALGKVGNIVAERLCFLSMFPCLPTSRNIVAETKFLLPRKQKCLPTNLETFLLRKQCFLVCPQISNVSSTRNIVFPIRHVKIVFNDYIANINNTLRFVRVNVSQKTFLSLPTVGHMTKHRQETMFAQQCFLVCPGLKISRTAKFGSEMF